MANDFLRLQAVSKRFGANAVVQAVDLTMKAGEFVTLLGPSGCGKTTILRMVAGFERPTSGAIVIDGQDLTNVPPNLRKIGMVFQSYALFPNMRVADNIGFGLKIAGMGRQAAQTRVEEMLELIGLPGYGPRHPFELSGGQQQRVALARAIAPGPRILLLDEPLSALDAKIRGSLREEIRAIQRRLGITTIFVTHDQEEALSMSDRVVVMNAGRVEQIGTPFEVYNFPSTRFVASFVGTLNVLDGRVVDAKAGVFAIDDQNIVSARGTGGGAAGDRRAIALRPEMITLSEAAADDRRNRMRGRVEEVSFLGAIVRVRVRFNGHAVSVDTFNSAGKPPPTRGAEVFINFDPEDVLVLEN